MNTTTPRLPFKTKLRNALDHRQVGATDLIRRLGYTEHTLEFDTARRRLHRHLSGKTLPRREMRRRYEMALELDLGDLEPDDEEGESAMSLDDFMRLRARQILAEERAAADLKSNAPAAPLARSTAGASTEGA